VFQSYLIKKLFLSNWYTREYWINRHRDSNVA